MRTTYRFSAVARILGAAIAAALISLAAAPQANAQTPFSVTTTPTGAPTVGGLFEVTFQFKTDAADTNGVAVKDFTFSDISVTDGTNPVGTVQSIRHASTTNIYTVRIRANSGYSGSATVTLRAGAVTYTDTAPDPDVDYASTEQTVSVSVDQTKPTVALQVETLDASPVVDADNLVNGKFQVRFTFADGGGNVTGFTLGDIAVYEDGTLIPDATALSNFETVTAGSVYTVDVEPSSNFDGELKVVVPGGSVTDAVGNMIEKTEHDVMVDQTKPTVTISAPAQWGNTTFMITVTFDEDVQDFTADEITIATTPDADTDPTRTFVGTSVLNANGSETFTVNIAGTAATTTQLAISVAADAAYDPAGIGTGTPNGNGNAASSAPAIVMIDAARPTVSPITTTVPALGANNVIDLSPDDVTSFTAQIVFNDQVVGFQQGATPDPDITVTHGTVTLAGGLPGTTFTATITPDAGHEGEMEINIPANAAQSNADNTKGNPKFTQTVRVSQGAPTVAVTADKSRTNGPFGVTITFSEPVTGFMMEDISITDTANTDAEVSNFSGGSGTTYATTYRATVTPSDDAVGTEGSETTITISVAAGVAMDIVGNTNTASPDVGSEENPNPVVTFDDTAPTVTISAPGSASAPFKAIFRFSENITDSSFTANDISVANGTAGPVQGAGMEYTSMITPTQGFNGTLGINVAANVVTDIAGNSNTAHDYVPDVEGDAATQGSQPFPVLIDQVAPTAEIEDTTPPGQRKENDAFTITIEFSEEVTGLTADGFEISATNAGMQDNPLTTDVDESETTVPDATVSNIQGGGTAWTALITPRAADAINGDNAGTPNVDESMPFTGNLTVQIKADAAADSSGGGNTASNTLTVNIDTVGPTLTIATSDTRGAGTNFKEAFTATFTFNEAVTGFDSTDIVITNGSIATPSTDFSGSGTTYRATITPTAEGALTIAVAADVAEDSHGNGNVVYDRDGDADTTGDSTFDVTIDTTAPVPAISTVLNAGTLTQFGHAQNLQFTVSFANGAGATNEEVTGLAAGAFSFKYVTHYSVANDNGTPDDDTDDATQAQPNEDSATETNGGARVVSIVPSPSETDHTYTVTIDPAAFSLGSPTTRTVDRNGDMTNETETLTPLYRKLRIFINANSVMDLAANNNAAYDLDTGTEGLQGREVQIVPGIPTIAITTPGLTRTAFNSNPLSDGTAFMVRFEFDGVPSVGVFGVEDVSVTEAGSAVTGAISNFSGSGRIYTATITPTQDPTPDNDTEDGFNGDLAITVAGDIDGDGTADNFVTTHTVYVDQRTPAVATLTGIYLTKNADGTLDTTSLQDVSSTSTANVNGDPFYVQLTTSEQVERLGAADFVIYETGDSTKASVGTASEVTAGDVNATTGVQTWTAKITPLQANPPVSRGFNGDLSVEIKAANNAAMDRAGRRLTVPDIVTALSGIMVDQMGPVPVITFTATPHGNRLAADGTTQITHNVIPDPATTYTATVRFQNGNETDTTDMPVYEPVTASTGTPAVDNFTLADIAVSPSWAVAATGGVAVTDSGTADSGWTVTITPATDVDLNEAGDQPYEGPITISIPANRLVDGVGNMNAASNMFTVVIDRGNPTVTAITGTTGETVAPDQPFSINVAFSEDVTGFGMNADGALDADDVSIFLPSTGTVEDALAGSAISNVISGDPITTPLSLLRFEPIGGSKRNYKVTIRLNSANTDVTSATDIAVYVPATAAQDSAGNNNPVSWEADDDTDDDVEPKVFFTANINHDSLVATIISGGPAVADGITGGPTETADDVASMSIGSTHTDGSYWFRFTFSQLIEGFTESDFVVMNGSVVPGSLEKSNATTPADLVNKVYYARFTATRAADLVVSLPAGAVLDGASNPSLPASYLLDVGRPTATLKIFAATNTTYLDADQLTGPQNGEFKVAVQFSEAILPADKNDTGTNDRELALSFRGASQSGGVWDTTNDGDRYIATITPDASVGGNTDFDLVIGLATDAVRDTFQNGNAPVQKTVRVDKTAPTVMITPTEIGNNVANGNVFTVTLAFDEPVTGMAEDDISGLAGGTLVAGSLTRALNGSAVTDPTAPAQVYTVQVDPTADVTQVSFTFAAGAVMDLAGNNNAAYDGDAETPGDQPHTITVDTVAPTPVITGPAKYGNGPILVTIMFTDAPTVTPLVGEDVTGFDASDLAVTGGTVGSLIALSGSQYQVNITPNTSVSQITVDIAANAALDGAGNYSAAATQFTAAYDSTLPYVSGIVAPAAARTEFTATINFNEAVTGFDAADVAVTGGTVKPGSLITISSSSYSVVIVPNPAVADNPATTDVNEAAPAFEGDLSISIAAGAATAAAAPAGRNTVASAVQLVRIDLTAPTVTAFRLNGGQQLSFNQFNFSVAITFDEDVDISTWATTDLTVSGGSVTSVGNNGSRTLTANISSPTQLATVSLGANVVTDIVGNGNAAHAGATIARATNAPTVTVSAADGSLTRNTSPFQVRIVFNQPVTGFVLGDLTVTGGTADQFQAVSGQIYTARITPAAGQSSVAISVAANVAVNTGGINNVASNTLTVNISTSSRTVSVTSAAQAPVSGAFNVNISFSEATSGFAMNDITVLNGTVTSLTHVSLSRNWVASITPTGPEVSVYVVQNVVDGGNAPSNVFRIRSNVGSSVPSGLSVSLTGQAAVKAGASTVNILFTRDGVGVPVTGLALDDLSVTPSSIALTNLTPHATDAGRYMVTLTPPNDFEGDVTVTLAANAARDDRGNNSPAGSFRTRVDSTPPTVEISGPAGPANGAVDLTITFSESVTGFDADDLTVSGGTAGDITGSGAVYRVTVTPADDYNGQLTADIAADAAMDTAGNMSTAAEQYAVTIDQTPPTVSVTGPEGPIKDEMIMIMIAFSEAVTGFELSDIAVGNGSASDLAADETTPGLYTAMIQADSGFEGMLTVDIAAGAAADMATNASMAAEQYAVEVVLDTSFTIALNQGLNMIHVPVKVDGLAMVSNLYDALGGSSDVLYILSLDGSGNFVAYVGIPGSSGDTALSDQTAVVVNMRTAKSVTFTGGLLDDTVSLTQGINLIGVPRAGAVAMASEVAPDATAVLVLTTDSFGEALFELVIPNTPSDVAAVGGQGYIVVAGADDSITYTGEAWEDPEDTAMSAASTEAVKYDPTSTPVLLIEGSFAREDTQEPVNGLQVTIKNLRTGESAVDTAGLTAGSGRFVKPMIALRGDRYEEGDMLEVSVVDPSGTFGGLTPVRTVVSKDEIAAGRINIGRQLLSAVPHRSDLLPNYPNPFNPETWIPFDLAEASQTTVTIYNAAGQTVRVLELGQLPAGQYRSRSKAAYWDGRNALGERVSSGLYFYRIEAGSFSALRRMVILK